MYHLIDYVWCVEKFSQYLDTHEQEVYPLLTSPIFAYKNTRWVLNLYPEGLGDTASHGYISLFIKYVSEDPETINAKVELSLLNNKNERVYCRDTGDHQYQTFIDFGYKQFLKIQDIKEQKDDLVFNGVLKIFARVEFEHATLPSSLTWTNYDLLLFKENFKDLYETKNLCDIIVKVIKKPLITNLNNNLNNNTSYENDSIDNIINQYQLQQTNSNALSLPPHNIHYHPYANNLKKTNKLSNVNNKFLNISCSDVITSSETLVCDKKNENENNFLTLTNNSTHHKIHKKIIKANFNNSNSTKIEPPTMLFNDNNHSCIIETLEIKAHKFVLASRSGKFRELLKTNLIKINSLLSSIKQMNSSKTNSSNENQFSQEKAHCLSNDCIRRIKNLSNEDNSISSYIGSSSLDKSSLFPLSFLFSDSSLSFTPQCTKINDFKCSCLDNSIPPKLLSSCASIQSSFVSLPKSSSTSETIFSKNNFSSSTVSSSFFRSNNILNETNAINENNFKKFKSTIIANDLDEQIYSDIADLLIVETDRSPKVIEYLIRYMYTGYLDSLDTYAKDIYEISKEFKVHGLTNLAREHIIKELNIQNCCDFLIFCVINNDYELNSKIQAFITENFETIIKTNAYKQAKRKYRELFENTFREIFKKIPAFNKINF